MTHIAIAVFGREGAVEENRLKISFIGNRLREFHSPRQGE